MKRGQGAIAGLMIGLIIAAICGGIIWTLIKTQRDTTTTTAQMFTASNSSYVTLTADCIYGNPSYKNATGTQTIGAGNFSVVDGTVLLTGDDTWNGKSVNATYNSRSCAYIDGMSGTLVDYVGVMVALLIFVLVGGYIYAQNRQ